MGMLLFFTRVKQSNQKKARPDISAFGFLRCSKYSVLHKLASLRQYEA